MVLQAEPEPVRCREERGPWGETHARPGLGPAPGSAWPQEQRLLLLQALNPMRGATTLPPTGILLPKLDFNAINLMRFYGLYLEYLLQCDLGRGKRGKGRKGARGQSVQASGEAAA